MNEHSVQPGGYFLYHSIGQFEGKDQAMAAALAGFAGFWGAPDDGQWGQALALKARFLALWRQVIGAPEGSVTTCESVTAGLYAIIGALPADRLRGKRLLVAGDCFPSLHFLLSAAAARFGFTLDTVPLREGEFWVRDEDMIAAWGADVGLALLTLTTSTASHRPGLAELVAHGRAQGSLIGVDITQGAGVVPYSVDAPEVDFTISTSLKWLCGAPGAGIVHVHPRLIGECRPEFCGWFSQENPFSWDLDAFEYAPDIRRFDNGTPAVLAAAASIPGLEWYLTQAPGAIARHNLELCEQIIERADAAGLRLASPRQAERRGGSVMLQIDNAAATVDRLRAHGLFTDARGKILRLSPGWITEANAVDRLFDLLSARD
ncbi:MAG: aminotransferase class V-fold PLP-dependent enzyme [Pararhodobacter sp.]|nr:aminotransferase class V-fold PLP-dependent enzyme [Pararhodobacter sp.]